MDAEKSLNLNRLALYVAGDKITRSTFNKMRIGAELFPLTKIKDEPVEESFKPADASVPAQDAGAPPIIRGTISSALPAQMKLPH